MSRLKRWVMASIRLRSFSFSWLYSSRSMLQFDGDQNVPLARKMKDVKTVRSRADVHHTWQQVLGAHGLCGIGDGGAGGIVPHERNSVGNETIFYA